MKFNILTEVIYTTADGERIYTYIKRINEGEQKYVLDYNLDEVDESQVELNTMSNFNISLSSLSTQKAKNYSRNRLIDRVVLVLNRNIDDEDVLAVRYMENIIIELPSADKFIDNGEAKVISKFNKLIQFVNSKITDKQFNESISVELSLPMKKYALDSIMI